MNEISPNRRKKLFVNNQLDYQEEIDQFDSFISILKKDSRQRNPRDIILVSKYLENTELVKRQENEKNDDKSLRKLILFCSSGLQYEYIEAGKTLFKEGDIGDKFYIILKGIVSVLKHKEKEKKMTSEEYLLYLSKLNEEKEYSLIRKTIKVNQNQYFVDPKDKDSLIEILFLVKLRKLLLTRCDISMIEDLLNQFNRIPETYGFSYNQLHSPNFLNNIISARKMIFDNLKFSLYNYLYLENTIEKKSITFFSNEFLVDLNTGKFFGDLALDDKSSTRMASIVAKENTHLGYILVEMYKQQVFKEKQKLRISDCMFYLQNFLRSTNLNTFLSKYLMMFAEIEHQKNDVICCEGENLEYFFLITEGEIELTINVNFSELQEKIEVLSKLLKKVYSISTDFKKSFIKKNTVKRKIIKLLILNQKQDIGIIEYFLDLPAIYQATAISYKVKLCKIAKEEFIKILKEEECSNKRLFNMGKDKASLILKRLIELQSLFIDEIPNENVKIDKNGIQFTEVRSKSTSNIVFQFTLNTQYQNLIRKREFMPRIFVTDTSVPALTNQKSNEKLKDLEIIKKSTNKLFNLTPINENKAKQFLSPSLRGLYPYDKLKLHSQKNLLNSDKSTKPKRLIIKQEVLSKTPCPKILNNVVDKGFDSTTPPKSLSISGTKMPKYKLLRKKVAEDYLKNKSREEIIIEKEKFNASLNNFIISNTINKDLCSSVRANNFDSTNFSYIKSTNDTNNTTIKHFPRFSIKQKVIFKLDKGKRRLLKDSKKSFSFDMRFVNT